MDPQGANETTTAGMKELEKGIKETKEIIDEMRKRITDLQSTAFTLANYFVVFQGVIITIALNGSQVLRPSDRWFPISLSLLVVVLNLSALIIIGSQFLEAKGEQAQIEYKYNRKKQRLDSLKSQNGTPGRRQELRNDTCKDKRKTVERYLVFSISILFFVAFSVIVVAGCWIFLRQKDVLGHDKCTRLCGKTNCISICTE